MGFLFPVLLYLCIYDYYDCCCKLIDYNADSVSLSGCSLIRKVVFSDFWPLVLSCSLSIDNSILILFPFQCLNLFQWVISFYIVFGN